MGVLLGVRSGECLEGCMGSIENKSDCHGARVREGCGRSWALKPEKPASQEKVVKEGLSTQRSLRCCGAVSTAKSLVKTRVPGVEECGTWFGRG